MKTEDIKKLTVAKLKEIATKGNIDLKGATKKDDIVSAMVLSFAPKVEPTEDGKGNTLQKAKEAKKSETVKGKLSLTFDALKSAHDNKEKIVGIETTFWKSNPKRGDFDGVTVRFTKEECTGVDKAILSTLKKAITGAGMNLSAMTIRQSGSAALFVK